MRRSHWASANFRSRPTPQQPKRGKFASVASVVALALLVTLLVATILSPRFGQTDTATAPRHLDDTTTAPVDDAGSEQDRTVPPPRVKELDLKGAVADDEWALTAKGNAFVDNLVTGVIASRRDSTRAALQVSRISFAESHGIAPVRACFVSLIRHSEDGVRKLHRLLANVRQQMPKMAGRYPFVAFHESVASSGEIAKRLLTHEVDFVEGHDPHSGSVWPHQQEVLRAGAARQTLADDDNVHAHEATVVTHKLIDSVAPDDAAAYRFLLKKFVFPKSVTHPDPQLRTDLWQRLPTTSGVTSGVELVALPTADFGDIPSHLKPKNQWPYAANSYWGVGYRHMCRFFGIRIFFTPYFQENRFDFYLRLDTDSYILGPLLAPPSARTAEELNTPAHSLEEQDLFVAMHQKRAEYGFSMMHPQTIPQFMTGLYETYDHFRAEENADKYSGGQHAAVERGRGTIGRSTSSPLHDLKSELPFPRKDGVHYWDNFEIVDLTMFRELPVYDVALRAHADKAKSTLHPASDGVDIELPSVLTSLGIGRVPLDWHIHDFNVLPPSATAGEELVNGDSELVKEVLHQLVEASKNWSAVEVDDARRFFLAPPRGAASDVSTPPAEIIARVLQKAAARQAWKGEWVGRAQSFLRRWYDTNVARPHNERLRRMKLWFDRLDAEGGFYYHRWGDAEVRTLTMTMFVDAKQIAWVSSLPYQHYFNFICPALLDNVKINGGGAVGVKSALHSLTKRAKEACETEARSGGGEGKKQRGTARMMPAEMSHYNHAFEAARKMGDGGRWPTL